MTLTPTTGTTAGWKAMALVNGTQVSLGLKDAEAGGGERQKQEQANITRSAVTAL